MEIEGVWIIDTLDGGNPHVVKASSLGEVMKKIGLPSTGSRRFNIPLKEFTQVGEEQGHILGGCKKFEKGKLLVTITRASWEESYQDTVYFIVYKARMIN